MQGRSASFPPAGTLPQVVGSLTQGRTARFYAACAFKHLKGGETQLCTWMKRLVRGTTLMQEDAGVPEAFVVRRSPLTGDVGPGGTAHVHHGPFDSVHG